jgi:hypothetical protein
MVRRMYKKGLVVGIIVLLIGVGSPSVFAVEDNTSTESFTIDNDNENPNTMSRRVYENTNCYVRGFVSEAFKDVNYGGSVSIVFGFRNEDRNEDEPTGGWIYTNGDNGKWTYWSFFKGAFFGDIRSYWIRHWYTRDKLTMYVGLDGFKGLILGGTPWFDTDTPSGALCWFIGRAEHVKIRTA